MLIGLDYVDRRTLLKQPVTPMAGEVISQLKQYFKQSGYEFNLPLQFDGTSHQHKVWQALRQIKSGETTTYGQLADKIKSGARAVGNSCRHNPISIVIPCHRVVAASGIGGYGGHVDGEVLQRKHWLLKHEGLNF